MEGEIVGALLLRDLLDFPDSLPSFCLEYEGDNGGSNSIGESNSNDWLLYLRGCFDFGTIETVGFDLGFGEEGYFFVVSPDLRRGTVSNSIDGLLLLRDCFDFGTIDTVGLDFGFGEEGYFFAVSPDLRRGMCVPLDLRVCFLPVD